MKILFTGGGTLGSVTPLLALYEELAIPPLNIRGGEGELYAFWIGTYNGIERELIDAAHIPFYAMSAGKWRRYLDWRTLFAPCAVFVGFLQSFFLLIRLRPTVVVGAGGYVAVPVIWAAWCLRIPCYTMQLDVLPGLANRLVMPFVRNIFCAFTETAQYFPKGKVVVTGVPVRKRIMNPRTKADALVRGRYELGVSNDRPPLLLVIGGGTGALRLNEIVGEALSELTKLCRVVHVTGKNKLSAQHSAFSIQHYQRFDFLTDQLFQYYEEASLVLTRAGMGTLSELALAKKAAIVIPLPDTPQGHNAAVLTSHDAAVVLQQDALTREKLVDTVRVLLRDEQRRRALGEKLHQCIPTDGVEKIVQFLIHHS